MADSYWVLRNGSCYFETENWFDVPSAAQRERVIWIKP